MKSFTVDFSSRYLKQRNWPGALAFWFMAALLRWWAAPVFEQLPTDYVAETSYAAKLWSRQTPSSPAEESVSIVRRRDQTLTSSSEHSIIQGDAHWLTTTGAVIFETFSLYGVDRRTRENLTGYGTQDRTGQYLFPPHTGKKQYGLWDPNYSGLCVVTFDHVELFRGVEVYVFNSRVDGIDETEGYASNPEVPEKYNVLTYGAGRYRIEPVSGLVVDHVDDGVSYFVEPKSGRRVGEPINQWSERYTPETIHAQLQLATTTRRWIRALEVWLPFTFAVAGLIWVAIGFRSQRRGTR